MSSSSSYISLLGPKPFKKSRSKMSRVGNKSSANRPPPPPPPPPPPLSSVSSERVPKLKVKSSAGGATRTPSSKGESPGGSLDEVVVTSRRYSKEEKRRTSDPSTTTTVKQTPQESIRTIGSAKTATQLQSKDSVNNNVISESSDQVNVERNEVPWYDEEACTSSDDEFTFTCCIPPFSPRYPPNPRPQRDWDPSVLPAGTNIPTSIGRPCRRCGKLVYLAELHLSSRGAYHTECFKCCLCGKSLDSWTFAEYKGEIFCKGCYRRNFGAHGVGFGLGAGAIQTP